MPYTKKDVAAERMVDGERVKLSDAERTRIAKEWTANEAAEAPERVRRARAKAYPPIGDQLDAILKQMAADRAAGKTLEPEAESLVDRVAAVKAAHPKPD